MDLLVLADMDGVVDMTPSAIAARTRIPLQDVTAMLAMLEQPDPESRTPDHDGRRIKRLDEHRSWGWGIINYKNFRQTATEEQRREKTRARVAIFREKHRHNTTGNALVTPANAGNAGNAGNAMQKHKQMQTQMEKQKKKKTTKTLAPRAAASKKTPADLNEVYLFAAENNISDDVVNRWLRYNETEGWQIHKSWRAALRCFAEQCEDSPQGVSPVPDGWEPVLPVASAGDEPPTE